MLVALGSGGLLTWMYRTNGMGWVVSGGGLRMDEVRVQGGWEGVIVFELAWLNCLFDTVGG